MLLRKYTVRFSTAQEYSVKLSVMAHRWKLTDSPSYNGRDMLVHRRGVNNAIQSDQAARLTNILFVS